MPRHWVESRVSGRMTTAPGIAVVLLVQAASNVRIYLGPRRLHPLTGPLTALLLLLVGRMAGLTWEEVGLGRQTPLTGALVGGAAAACVAIVSAVIFGLWHVLPALELTRTNTSLRRKTTAGGWRVTLTVLATIAFTSVAGIVFAELRRRSGSLLAPIGLHWATNGLGVLAAAYVWAASARGATTAYRP